MPRIVALLLFLSVFFCGKAQKYTFVRYSTEQGLPQSQVTAITQDTSGYLWVGTLGGLARFNGKEFKTYSTSDGLVNFRITSLNYFDKTLWIGHDGGISVIKDEKVSKFLFSGDDKSRNVSDIIKFRDKIFVCSNGGGLFVLENERLKTVHLENEDFLRIRKGIVNEGILYLATRGGILKSTDGIHFVRDKQLPDYSFSSICASDNSIYFTTYTEGVFRLDRSNGNLDSIAADKFEYSLFTSSVDHEGNVWFSTLNGILMLDLKGNVNLINDMSGLPSNVVSCLFEDKDKNSWIGSQGKGLFRFSGNMFRYYDNETGLPSDLYVSGFEKANGDAYLGTYDAGVVKRNRSGEVIQLDISESPVWASLEAVNGKDWFATQSALISVDAKGKIQRYYAEDGAPGQKVTALFKVSSGKMYIGGNDGVSVYQNGSFRRIGSKNAEVVGTVRDFELRNGLLYCASNLGVFVLKGNEFVAISPERRVVYNIEKDVHNNLWFGTEEGLYKYNDSRMTRITLLADPGSNFINFINQRAGVLFVGTNNGLFVLNDLNSDKPTFKRYGVAEGVVDLETNLNSGFFDRNGNLWFGTATGLVFFDVSVVKDNHNAPVILLKDVVLNYEHFNFKEFSSRLSPSGLPTDLELPYFKNNLIFEFDAVSLTNSRGLKFQYVLEGLSDTWSPLSEVPTITFNSLPAGNYTLRVRAVDQDGRISNELTFPFVIREAFFRTWWFISLVVLAVLSIFFLVFRSRLRRIREANERERLEFKTRLLALEQQSVNASMNRHFIFNSLNSIQYFINTQDKRSANKYLTDFAQLIRKNLDSANAENNMITLEEELSRIKLYLGLEAMRFQGRFDYWIDSEDVDTESIMIPSMIMQPFVENSIIHGLLPMHDKKGEISIRIYQRDNFLFISIKDNGIGIDHSLASKEEMEGDHRSQGMEITSKRIELLRKIASTEISLDGPKEIIDENGSVSGTYVLIKIPLEDLEI